MTQDSLTSAIIWKCRTEDFVTEDSGYDVCENGFLSVQETVGRCLLLGYSSREKMNEESVSSHSCFVVELTCSSEMMFVLCYFRKSGIIKKIMAAKLDDADDLNGGDSEEPINHR